MRVRITLPLCLSVVGTLGLFIGCASVSPGEQPSGSDASGLASTLQSLPAPTLGGTQFWTDQYFFHQWRIQRRANSDEYRLLDDSDWQHASGTFEQCRVKLDQIRRERKLKPMSGDAVVLVHGLAAPGWSMHLLGKHLNKHMGVEVFNVEYASTRCSIDDHARSFARIIARLEGIEKIHMVGHSMGNIVIRRYLAGETSGHATWQADPRVGRIVMIAPPNHGSITASRLSDYGLFKTVFGDAGRQLGVEWKRLEPKLATPTTEFGIIAGGLGNKVGFSVRLPGDDDGRITVKTTQLAGAADFIVVGMLHELIANDPRVLDYTLHFLQHGWFVSAEQRRPIPLRVAAADQAVPAGTLPNHNGR